jgi:mxaK protein
MDMTRFRIHIAFAVLCATLVANLGVLQWRLLQVRDTVSQVALAGADDSGPAPSQIHLARALALARAGRFEAAVQGYKQIVQTEQGAMRDVAQFDEANLMMREALKDGAQFAVDQLPLIEMAKQGYRDLLRRHPDDWDVRYNLERALWVAPEFDDAPAAIEDPADERERAITTMHGFSRDLP